VDEQPPPPPQLSPPLDYANRATGRPQLTRGSAIVGAVASLVFAVICAAIGGGLLFFFARGLVYGGNETLPISAVVCFPLACVLLLLMPAGFAFREAVRLLRHLPPRTKSEGD
jgi:hypothetical protein